MTYDTSRHHVPTMSVSSLLSQEKEKSPNQANMINEHTKM